MTALIGILGIGGGVIVFAIALIIAVVQMIDRGRERSRDAVQR